MSAVGTKFYVGGRLSLTHFVGAFWEIIAVKGATSDAVAAFEAYAKAKYGLYDGPRADRDIDARSATS